MLVSVAVFVLWVRRNDREPARRGPGSRPNVLLVTIDTLRADRVGRGLTPAIDALGGRGEIWTHVRATAPLTLPSHVSLLTGTLPPAHGVRENGVLFDRRVPTIARLFKDAGYRTGAFVGAYVLNRRFGLDDGFDTYDDEVRRDVARAEQLEAERPGGEVVDAALAWLGGASGPFFLWVHLYDPHAPYAPPPGYLEKANGVPYDAEVLYSDTQVARLVEALATRGLTDSTVVAVTGDHGEALGEHGEATHGMLAYDSTLRVPLVIAIPGGTAGRERSPASLADLGPRLLREAGIGPTRERSPLYSESYYPRRAGWHALSVIVDERWKLIRSSETELYEIASDPAEARNVASAHPNVVQAMSAALDRLKGSGAPAPAVSAEAAERLRALGDASGAAAITTDDARATNPARAIGGWTRFESALSLLQSGDARAAVVTLRALAREHPEAPVFHTTLARALRDAGDPKAALEIYKSAATRWPGDPALYHDLAVAAREAGEAAEALRAERAALALDDKSAMAQNGLGLIHADAGRDAEAAAAFERATALDPGNPSYWSNLGNARRARGDAAAAEQAYRRALQEDDGFVDALNGLGALYVQSQRAAEAVPLFERALQREPARYEVKLNLGIALQESGQRERAASVYLELLKTAPASARREREAADQLLRTLRAR